MVWIMLISVADKYIIARRNILVGRYKISQGLGDVQVLDDYLCHRNISEQHKGFWNDQELNSTLWVTEHIVASWFYGLGIDTAF